MMDFVLRGTFNASKMQRVRRRLTACTQFFLMQGRGTLRSSPRYHTTPLDRYSARQRSAQNGIRGDITVNDQVIQTIMVLFCNPEMRRSIRNIWIVEAGEGAQVSVGNGKRAMLTNGKA